MESGRTVRNATGPSEEMCYERAGAVVGPKILCRPLCSAASGTRGIVARIVRYVKTYLLDILEGNDPVGILSRLVLPYHSAWQGG